MKKLLVLSVLLGLLALPVFANHVSIDMGGDMTFGVMSDFSTAGVDPDLTWDVIVGLDDYNSFTWSLKGLGAIALDKALVTTDIGMWLGLPVGIMVNWGYDDPARNQYESTSGYANEELGDFSPKEYWGLDFLVSAGMAEVELAFNPIGVDGGFLLAGLAVKEPVPGLNAEVYYFQGGPDIAGDAFDQGNIAFAAEYAMEVSMVALDIGAGFLYNLADTGDAWGYGIGLAADTGMFGATVGLAGNETDVLATLSATVTVAPVDMVTIYAGLLADLQDAAAETLDSVDLGVNAHVGIVECYLGYLITSTGAVDGTYNAPAPADLLPNPAAGTDGGLYLKFDVDY